MPTDKQALERLADLEERVLGLIARVSRANQVDEVELATGEQLNRLIDAIAGDDYILVPRVDVHGGSDG